MRDNSWDFGLQQGERFEPDCEDDESIDWSLPHVMTALGPIAPAELGFTLAHEHINLNPDGDETDVALDDPHRVLRELEAYYLAGGRTIVDASTADCRRDPTGIAWIANRTPVNLVVATGFQQDVYSAPFLGQRSAEEIAEVLVREISGGIENTALRAGVIRAGTSLNAITAVEERVLRAAAWAQLETGAPIATHSEAGMMALDHLRILMNEGAEAAHILVGHLDRALDDEYVRQVLDTGSFVSFDLISQVDDGRDEDEASMVKRVVDAGYGDQIVLSGGPRRQSTQFTGGGEPGWAYLVESVPLMLMETGLEAAVIRQIFVDNPARALTIVPSSRHIP